MGNQEKPTLNEAALAGLYPSDTAERIEKSIDDHQARLLAVLRGAEVQVGIKKVIAEAFRKEGIGFGQRDWEFSSEIFSDIAPELDLTVNWQIVVDMNLNRVKVGWLISSN